MADGRTSLGSQTIDAIYVSPIGGGADDWPTIIGLANQFAGKKTVVLGPGTFICNTPSIQIESGARIEMSPDTIINSTISHSGTGGGHIFMVDYFNSSTLQNAGNVLSSTATVGSKDISVTSATGLAIGDPVFIVSVSGGVPDGGFVDAFRITNISGTTITLDEPVLMPFPSGCQVKKASHDIVENIHINGNGALITGSASCAVEIFGSRNCTIENLNFDGIWALWAANFDYGCHNVHFKNCNAIFNTKGQWGFGLELSRNSSIQGCSTLGAFTGGGFLLDSVQSCELSNNISTNGVRGYYAVSITSAYTWGNHNLLFNQCRSVSMSGAGFHIVDGSDGISFVECESTSTVNAFLSSVVNNTVYAKNITFLGGKFTGTTSGMRIDGGSGINIHGTNVSGSGIGLYCTAAHETIGVSAFGMVANDCGTAVATSGSNVKDMLLVGVQARRSTDFGMQFAGTSHKLIGCDLTDAGQPTTLKGQVYCYSGTPKVEMYDCKFGFSTNPGAIVSYGIRADVASEIIIENCEQFLPDPSTGATIYGIFLNNAGAILRYSNFRIIDNGGGGSGGTRNGIVTNAACTLYKGTNVDVSAAPYNFLTTPKKNFGTFVANGTTAVNITNAVYPSTDSCVSFSLATAGGTVGHTPFISTALSGTTFSVKADALDTSAYNWQAL